jgi:hypothetical protein
MLLANPHFPWVGGMRFYEMHPWAVRSLR